MKYDVYAKGQGGWFITQSMKNLSDEHKDDQVAMLTNLGYTHSNIQVVCTGTKHPRIGSNNCSVITKLMQF